ncbi:potassium-transporting ATPase subunit KdpC [Sphingomonas changnyeongensis]|uniref:Potassium-transporting ATPase KdpC subunit n=1 Tax=Sphingomonas changnyeongensis TaxID=2698679 RepID=A0A7Z2S7M9_9SPHN|nr:potassium-transporting ATPase subunit KdpC [Sphingomonas changnyeongensis]QHL90496.1 potassium-transporting ATPase subunit KdpC [Sphingomonas changnyeongensis]
MGKDLVAALRPALVFTLLSALLLGLAYPLAMTGIGQLIFPHQAGGSLVARDGRPVGSALIGQAFQGAGYFHPRPSAAGTGYDGRASGGSNLGPAARALVDRVGGDVRALRDQGVTGPVPADLVTASGSGLDPHVSPAAALLQVRRVAAARGLPEQQVRGLVERAIERPVGFLGEDRVNVLMLNLSLDRIGQERR